MDQSQVGSVLIELTTIVFFSEVVYTAATKDFPFCETLELTVNEIHESHFYVTITNMINTDSSN